MNPSATNARTLPRVLAAVMALPPTGLTVLFLVHHVMKGFDPIGAAMGSVALTIAALCWWFALRGHFAESRVRMRYAIVGAVALGGIAFAAGFFGPILFMPGANQGPLLGIFITGPFGFAAGATIGALYARFRR